MPSAALKTCAVLLLAVMAPAALQMCALYGYRSLCSEKIYRLQQVTRLQPETLGKFKTAEFPVKAGSDIAHKACSRALHKQIASQELQKLPDVCLPPQHQGSSSSAPSGTVNEETTQQLAPVHKPSTHTRHDNLTEAERLYRLRNAAEANKKLKRKVAAQSQNAEAPEA